MAFEDLAVALSAVAGAVAAAGQVAVRVSRRRQHRVTKQLAEGDRANVDVQEHDDLAAVHDRLFNDVGRLSLQEYVGNQEARELVARATARAQALVDIPEPTSADPTPSSSGGSHIDVARAALGAGDVVSALARSRLALEIALRDVAAVHGVDARRQTGGRLIRLLVQVGGLDPAVASPALEAFQIASRGLHGERVSAADAEWVVKAVADVVRTLGDARGRR